MSETLLFAACVWLVCVNLFAVVLTVSDKRRSMAHRFRVPEKILFLCAFLGGSVGEYCAMRIVRHKTLHKRFMWGLPALIAAQTALLIAVLLRYH